MKRIHIINFMLLFISYPVFSQNTEFSFSLINPRITSADLSTAWFFDGSSGYIAGGAGAVLFTNDSGKTWRECNTPKRTWIASLFFHDIQNGWAAGGANGQLYLISTKDGGNTWLEHDVPELVGGTIWRINFRNRTDGWITGGSMEGGFVYRTEDGGNTWVDRSPDSLVIPHHVIEDILFIDSSAVIICGYHGYLARSSDNGLHWQRIEWKSIASDTSLVFPLEEFQKVDSAVIFCKGREDILRSDDGGSTWKHIFNLGAGGSMMLGGFYFHTADNGFAIGGFGEGVPRFTTKDGGDTWEAVKDTVGEVTGPILFPGNGKTGYMIGRRAEVYRLTPMGENKVQLNTGYTWVSEPSVDFCDGSNGCIGGAKPIGLRKTSDGGKTWRIVDTGADYTGVIQKDDTHFALSNGMVSTDGGKTWQLATDGRGGGRTFYKTIKNDAVYFTQINEGGLGIRSFVTKDWFATSEECQMPCLGPLFFLNADTGWIAGKSLYLTTDGARSWEEVGPIDGITGANCICFIDQLHGWAGGVGTANGKPTTILRTSDGGDTWSPQETMQYLPDSLYPPATPIKGRLPTRICAENFSRAWFIDGFFCVFHTNDGGAVWQQVALPQKCGDAYVSGTIALAGDGSLFCTGDNGMVLRISAKSGNYIRSNIQNTFTLPEGRRFSLMLPFTVYHKQSAALYQLNGARINSKNKGRIKNFCSPLLVKEKIPGP